MAHFRDSLDLKHGDFCIDMLVHQGVMYRIHYYVEMWTIVWLSNAE